MKPTWDKAPKWAKWLAQDKDGRWFWFETEPKIDSSIWIGKDDCRLEQAIPVTEWKTSLEARPK